MDHDITATTALSSCPQCLIDVGIQANPICLVCCIQVLLALSINSSLEKDIQMMSKRKFVGKHEKLSQVKCIHIISGCQCIVIHDLYTKNFIPLSDVKLRIMFLLIYFWRGITTVLIGNYRYCSCTSVLGKS